MMRERMTAIATSSPAAATSPSSVSSSLPVSHVGIASSSASKPAGTESSLGSSLSCLSWLTTLNVNNLGALSPASYASSQHSSSEDDDGDDILSIDWQSDASKKPPFAYATLIYMALQESDSPRLALAEIYDYISDNFAYYRYADPGWKNSIRHNLSQERCFMKLDRDSTEKGKGGYWALNPNFSDYDYIANKRRRKFKNRNTSVPLNGRRKKSGSAKPVSCRGGASGRPNSSQGGKRRSQARSKTTAPSTQLDQLSWASSPESHQDTSLLGASAFVLRERNAEQPSSFPVLFSDSEAMAEHLHTTIVGCGGLDISMNGGGRHRLGSRRSSGAFSVVRLPSELNTAATDSLGDDLCVDDALALEGRRCQLHIPPASANLDDDKLGLSFCFKLMDVDRDPTMMPAFGFVEEQCVDSGSVGVSSIEGKSVNESTAGDSSMLDSPWSLSQVLQWSPADRTRSAADPASMQAAMLLGLSQSASDLRDVFRTPRVGSPAGGLTTAAASMPSTTATGMAAVAAAAPLTSGTMSDTPDRTFSPPALEQDIDLGKPMPLDWL